MISISAYSQDLYTECASANKYTYYNSDKKGNDVIKELHKHISMCYNGAAVAFMVDEYKQVFLIDNYSKTISGHEYLQEEILCSSDEVNDTGDYFITIVHSSPAQIAIAYTKFSGFSYVFYLKEIPMIKLNVKKIFKDENKNDTLNRGLSEQMNGKFLSPKEQAICPISIKKYLEEKIPSLKKLKKTTLSIGFYVLPDGSVKYTKDTNDISYKYAVKCGLDKTYDELYSQLIKMPKWSVPAQIITPIFIDYAIEFN
jgi:hypothetical protein